MVNLKSRSLACSVIAVIYSYSISGFVFAGFNEVVQGLLFLGYYDFVYNGHADYDEQNINFYERLHLSLFIYKSMPQ